MKWVTRARVKVDRVACPWLIRRFIDPAAEFLFVPADMVSEVAYAYCRRVVAGEVPAPAPGGDVP